MPRLKQIVKRGEVEVAKRRRICKFSRASIGMGESCLVIREGQNRFTYCRDTSLEMIRQARERLDELEGALNIDEDE